VAFENIRQERSEELKRMELERKREEKEKQEYEDRKNASIKKFTPYLASFSNDFFRVAKEFKDVIRRRIKSKSKKFFGTSPMELEYGWPRLRVSYHQYQETVYGNFDNKITMSVVMDGISFEAIYRNTGVFLRP